MDKLVLVTLLKDFLSIQYFISFLSCYTFSWLSFRAQLTKSPVCGITPSVEPSCGKHFKWKMFHQLYKLLCPHLLCKQPLLDFKGKLRSSERLYSGRPGHRHADQCLFHDLIIDYSNILDNLVRGVGD